MTSVRGASFLALIVMTASCKGGERRPSSRTESLQRAADANTSTEKHAFSALPPGEEADRLLAALGQCASTVALKFPSDWQASQSGGDDCITTEVKMPGEERPVWFGSCWGKPPEKAHAWKKVSDLGDTVTRCTFGRRYSQRIELHRDVPGMGRSALRDH